MPSGSRLALTGWGSVGFRFSILPTSLRSWRCRPNGRSWPISASATRRKSMLILSWSAVDGRPGTTGAGSSFADKHYAGAVPVAAPPWTLNGKPGPGSAAQDPVVSQAADLVAEGEGF